jgi:tight adherence protein C
MIVVIVVATWICLLTAASYYVKYRSEQEEVKQHLEANVYNENKEVDLNSKYSLLIKWMEKFSSTGEQIKLFSDPEEIEDDLIKSGQPYHLTIKHIHGAKIIGGLAGLSFGFLYYITSLLIFPLPFGAVVIVFFPVLGYLTPLLGLKYFAKKRQEQIRYDLPDFLDMMSITLQAGMGLDEALKYYVDTSDGPLSEEISRLNQEVQFGVQREIAYRDLLKRTDSPELEALVQALIQAHILGTPISQTFAEQADEMRRMRGEQAKEAAGKAEPKISAVGGLIIAPSIILLILASFVMKFFLADSSPIKSIF